MSFRGVEHAEESGLTSLLAFYKLTGLSFQISHFVRNDKKKFLISTATQRLALQYHSSQDEYNLPQGKYNCRQAISLSLISPHDGTFIGIPLFFPEQFLHPPFGFFRRLGVNRQIRTIFKRPLSDTNNRIRNNYAL